MQNSRQQWDTLKLHVMIIAKLSSKLISSNGERTSMSYAKLMINKLLAQKQRSSDYKRKLHVKEQLTVTTTLA